MNVKELKSFKMVYEKQSINKAAKELYITSQGLARIIGNLEQELSTTLFERTSKGVVGTKSADLLYDNANQLIVQFEKIEHSIRRLEEQESHLRIACARGVLNALSFRIILDYMNAYPQMDVTWEELSNDQVKEKVNAFGADVGIVVGKTDIPGTLQQFVKAQRVIILVYEGHPLYDCEEIELSQLADEKIIILNDQYQLYHDFKRECNLKGIVPNLVGKTVDSHFIYQMCRQKVGLGVLLDFSMDGFHLEGLRVVPLKEKLTWDIYGICHEKNRKYSNVESFLSYLESWKVE